MKILTQPVSHVRARKPRGRQELRLARSTALGNSRATIMNTDRLCNGTAARLRLNHVQLATPKMFALHDLVVSACTAAAVQPFGGPATAVAVTVTLCEGRNPCAKPLPEKYTPRLSAAKLS